MSNDSHYKEMYSKSRRAALLSGTVAPEFTLRSAPDFCGAMHPLVQAIQEAMGQKLCFPFRNFPLANMHPLAGSAAEAAEAAAPQGNYWGMHDRLFENQEALEYENLAEYAETLGLDSSRLIKEVLAHAHEKRVREDFAIGVNGTPTRSNNKSLLLKVMP